MRHFLVTGGAGFIGSHLCDALLDRGDTVTVLDDLSTGTLTNLGAAARPGLQMVQGSVTDAALVDRLVAQCDGVFHLAAAVGVRLMVEHPARTITTNVDGTARVLEAATRAGRPVLIASSSEVYGKSEEIPFREDGDLVLGATTRSRWGYACSKALDEFLALAWAREAGTAVVIARFFNTVGPRQTGAYGMVVPRLVSQALAGEPLTVHGDGQQTRCFTWVHDVVRASLALLDAPGTHGAVFNVGSTEETSILTLADRILAITGSRSAIRLVPHSEAYSSGFEDMPRRVPCVDRLRAAVGFAPQTQLDDILRAVVAAHRRPVVG